MLSTVSPKVADPALRTTLIENAARLIADEGRDALTLRRLASDVGTSTMAIYTHFGGMDELRREVRVEGFKRLGDHLNAVTRSRDPVFDLGLLGWAYCRNALGNPNLYRVMFMEPFESIDAPGYETFLTLVRAAERCAEEGRFDAGDATERARQIWALSHGTVSLYLSRLLTLDETLDTLWLGAVSLFIGFGGDARAVRRSMTRVRDSVAPADLLPGS